jgi:hypothetical protein
MYCSCLNQLSGQDDWERACGKAGRNHAKKEVCLAGLVTSHARSGTPVRRSCIAWEFPGSDTPLRSHRNLLTGRYSEYSLTGEQSIYRDEKVE